MSAAGTPAKAPSLRFKSALDEVAWPGVPDRRTASTQGLLFQLDRSQWLAPEEIERRQLQQLARLVSHAVKTVPFYRDRFASLPAPDQPEAWTPDLWRALPVLTREEIQADERALHSTDLPKTHGRTGVIHTSGSTGKPVGILRSELFTYFWRCITIRNHLWHRRDFGGTLALIRESKPGKAAYPDGKSQRNWGTPSGAGIITGPCHSLNIHSTVEQQVEWLRRHDPSYLLTHPTNAKRLAEYCIAEGLELPALREVVTIAELLGPDVRDLCREAWGVPLADIYSGRDVGYMALQCPDAEHYHVQSEVICLEVVDEAGRPCRPGEIGRVLVTPLHNYAMPLIRYEVGDFAVVGEPCACGRGLPVLKRIQGRRQQLLRLPSGGQAWTLLSAGNIKDLLSLAPIKQYQFIQTELEQMEVRLATVRDMTPDEEAAVTAWVRKRFGEGFAVAFRYYDEIPRTEAGKFEDFICRVPA